MKESPASNSVASRLMKPPEKPQSLQYASMRWGHVAVLDLLGFKGIWQRQDPSLMLYRMKGAAEAIVDSSRPYCEALERLSAYNIKLDTIFVSDTIIIAVTHDTQPTVTIQRYSLFCLLEIALACSQLWLESESPMGIRGAIASGELVVDPPFLLGPCVDCAAGLHEQAQGAFIILDTDSAGPVLDKDSQSFSSANVSLVRWNIPFKGDTAQEMLTLDQLKPRIPSRTRRSLYDGLERSFTSEDPSVAIKWSNTATFCNSITP